MSLYMTVAIIGIGTAALAALIVLADIDLFMIDAVQRLSRARQGGGLSGLTHDLAWDPEPVRRGGALNLPPQGVQDSAQVRDAVPRAAAAAPTELSEGERWLAAMAAYDAGGPVPAGGGTPERLIGTPERLIGTGTGTRTNDEAPVNLPGRWVLVSGAPEAT